MIRRRSQIVTVFFLICGLAVASAVSAEPIVVTSGSAVFVWNGAFNPQRGSVDLVGTGGFSLNAIPTLQSAFPGSCFLCVPGQPYPLNANTGGLDLRGTASFNGASFSIGSTDFEHLGDVELKFQGGPALTPPLVGTTATVVAPFTLMGLLTLPTSLGAQQKFNILGSGLVTASLFQVTTPGVPPGWVTDTVRFDFAPTPTPEPGTIVLVGTALGGVFFRRYRRRSHERF